MKKEKKTELFADDEAPREAPPIMSMAAFARHIGVTQNAVRQAILHGRLSKASIHDRGELTPHIVTKQAELEWHTSRKSGGSKTRAAEREGINKAETIIEAQRRKEVAAAEMAELKLAHAKGELISAEEVKLERFKTARTIRDALLNFSERLAPELAPITDEHKVAVRIQDEVRLVLEMIRKDLESGPDYGHEAKA